MHLKALDHGLMVLDPRVEFLSIDITYQQLSVFHAVKTCFLTRYVDLWHRLYMQTQLERLLTR